MNLPGSTLAVIYAITAAASWGIAGVLSKFALGQGAPFLVVVLQLGCSVILSWFLTSVRCNSVEISSDALKGVSLGVLHPGLSNALGIVGLAHIDASISSTLWALEGPFTAVLAAFMLGERLRSLQAAFYAVSLVGVFLLSANTGTASWDYTNLYGVVMILVAVLCCAIYAVGCREFRASDPPQAMFIVSAQQTVGLGTCVALWLCHWSASGAMGLADLSWGVSLVCALTGPLKFLFATGLFVAALHRLSASYAGGFLVLTPVFGLSTAFLMLGEKLAFLQWAGILIVLLSVTISQWSWGKRDPSHQQLG